VVKKTVEVEPVIGEGVDARAFCSKNVWFPLAETY
jgi:hypothetical protein